MTTPTKALAALAFVAVLSLPLSAANAVTPQRSDELSLDAASVAQGRGKNQKAPAEEGLLDGIGLGSLAEIPWDAFGLGAVLSALVGAVGGFIYAGIAEPKEKENP